MAKKNVKVVINFLDQNLDDDENSVEFETNDAKEAVETLVEILSGWCVDQDIEIFVDGEQIH